MRVLLVEDDRNLAELLATALAEGEEPLDSSVAHRLQTALKALEQSEPDAILLDLNLPDSRGLDTLRAVLARARNSPVVVLTGLDDRTLAREALALGAQDWLAKGALDPEIIQRSIRYAIERKRLLDRVLRLQNIEVAARLASGVAHEFNNLLTAIQGSSYLIEYADADAGRAEGLALLRQAVDHGAALTQQLLSLARNPPINETVEDVSVLLSRVRLLVAAVLPETIRLEWGSSPHTFVRVDGGQFGQLLLNLALNARDAMAGNGGVLQVGARVVPDAPQPAGPSASATGRYVAIHVTDSGPGIQPAVRPRLFEPFFTTKAHAGTGLGLAVVKEIVDRFQGAIRVESELGRGATFTIYIPEASPPRGDASHAGPPE